MKKASHLQFYHSRLAITIELTTMGCQQISKHTLLCNLK